MTKLFTLCAGALISASSFAQNDVPFNASENWVAYMNIFNTGGGYEFGSAWALADTKSTLNTSANTLTLQPNFNLYADNPTDPYWVNQTTGLGEKVCEALTFVEPAGFNGSDLTFHGDVLSVTLDPNDFELTFFIKALDPANGYADALNGTKVFPLPASGPFTVTATGAELSAGLVIQYGFSVTGVNQNPLNEATLGSAVIGIDNGSGAGIDDLNEIKANVYPNPAQGQLYISTDANVTDYKIVNVSGQVVQTGEGSIIDISTFDAGTYLVHITTNEGTAVRRFIKQ